ncbi:unnamed protein product [Candida verbasci]|uniref:Uncharacterized protein n=1 Tax=Candida verbasci TaxID=1227364 RepID=A0A9W4TYQ2_9ASCO|nr:unnamed protein product [Candida verbasci]
MKFSTIALLSAVATGSIAAYANGTVTDIATTVVTITSCEENKCHETAVTTGLTTVTELETTYTTYCPLPTTEAPQPAPSHNSTVAGESSSVASSTQASVTAIEGAAVKVAVGGVAGLALIAALI